MPGLEVWHCFKNQLDQEVCDGLPPAGEEVIVKLTTDDLPILGYLIPASLIGGFAYRACMSGRGFGNFPGIAWLAAFGTGTMAFVMLIIVIEPWPLRVRLSISVYGSIVLMIMHLIIF